MLKTFFGKKRNCKKQLKQSLEKKVIKRKNNKLQVKLIRDK